MTGRGRQEEIHRKRKRKRWEEMRRERKRKKLPLTQRWCQRLIRKYLRRRFHFADASSSSESS
jgi:hypothetical protein